MPEIYDDFELDQHVGLLHEMDDLGYVAYTSNYQLDKLEVYGAIFVTRAEVAEQIAELNAARYCSWAANLREQGIDPQMLDFERETVLPTDHYIEDDRFYHAEGTWDALDTAAKLAYRYDPPQF